MKFMKNEEAVSPVIGVILMVAITVILAAVIGAFVFNIAGSTSSSKTVAITASLNAANNPVFTIQGGPDLASLASLDIQYSGNQTGIQNWTGSVTVGGTFTPSIAVTGSRMMVVGSFRDGSKQILFDKTY
jgi:flagellin-like protein